VLDLDADQARAGQHGGTSVLGHAVTFVSTGTRCSMRPSGRLRA
jgi:hypothetical protein